MLKLQVPPVYPERAREARLEGTVVLRVAINADGNVEAVRVLSGDPLLTAAASDAAKEWRYEPFLYECKAVPVSTQITIEFKLPRP